MNRLPPVFNPSVPFSTQIKKGLLEGMIITVCGRVLPDADRFHVNLKHNSDVVLHVNPRYKWFWTDCGYVVHNTCQKGTWGYEEHKSETPFPRGLKFALQILITQDSYKISANGKPFSEYKHRMPFQNVDNICIGGMVELNLVALQHLAPHHAAPLGSFMIPYKSIIHGGLQPDQVIIIIQGFVNPQTDRMGFSLRHKTGIAFDYSARFDENEIVCNSCEDGKWGEEERPCNMPFKRGNFFEVTICTSHPHYKVYVNGGLNYTYRHRFTKLEEIDVLEVTGDVQLSFVQP
ncbi:galectin-9-like [Ctenopharyngodon idella]|uniref:galectin-9-like n=1 Tax=Ctenopharyngodon idella TaxID=7959 RepID=UPI00223165FE|nr:galectin-9-like [Ctenopharyngodon idella]XP_051746591.1 galectin-9-like [Ctenopharyngodon idella]